MKAWPGGVNWPGFIFFIWLDDQALRFFGVKVAFFSPVCEDGALYHAVDA